MGEQPRTVEVDETRFLASQRTVERLRQMLANPKARKLVQDAEKIIDPNVVTPKDYQDEVLEELKKTNDELAAMKKAQEEDKAAREAAEKVTAFSSEWAKKKQGLAAQGYTAEGIEAIEKLAGERGIPDLEAAAALFDRLNPPAEPVSGGVGSGAWDLFEPPGEGEQGYVDKLLKSKGQDEFAVNQEVRKALSEFRGQRRAA